MLKLAKDAFLGILLKLGKLTFLHCVETGKIDLPSSGQQDLGRSIFQVSTRFEKAHFPSLNNYINFSGSV